MPAVWDSESRMGPNWEPVRSQSEGILFEQSQELIVRFIKNQGGTRVITDTCSPGLPGGGRGSGRSTNATTVYILCLHLPFAKESGLFLSVLKKDQVCSSAYKKSGRPKCVHIR